MIILIYFIEKFLVNAKKEELARNNNRMARILSKSEKVVKVLAENSDIITQQVEIESASLEELNSMQEELLIANSEKNRSILVKIHHQSNQFHQIADMIQDNTENVCEINRQTEELNVTMSDLRSLLDQRGDVS